MPMTGSPEEANEFQYVVLRAVPRVEREEYLNVGVILYCRARKYLDMRYHLDRQRLAALSPSCDADKVVEHLELLARICRGGKTSGPIGQLSQSERFQWFSAPRSTIIQPGAAHGGLCVNPQATLERLLCQWVLPPEPPYSV